jgi:hypothetical protein
MTVMGGLLLFRGEKSYKRAARRNTSDFCYALLKKKMSTYGQPVGL